MKDYRLTAKTGQNTPVNSYLTQDKIIAPKLAANFGAAILKTGADFRI